MWIDRRASQCTLHPPISRPSAQPQAAQRRSVQLAAEKLKKMNDTRPSYSVCVVY